MPIFVLENIISVTNMSQYNNYKAVHQSSILSINSIIKFIQNMKTSVFIQPGKDGKTTLGIRFYGHIISERMHR